MTLGLIILALAPIVAVIWYIYHKDKYEHEPWSFLFLAFLLGVACAAVAPLISNNLHWLPDAYSGRQMEIFLSAFVLAALVEETCKFICLRYIIYYRNPFNEPIDGIVYAVMIGMGFASLENLYFVLDGGVQTAIIRMFTAIPAHANFGIVMGYYTGKAKYIPKKNIEYSLKALLIPIFLHGIYNYLLLQDNYPYLGIGAILGLAVSFHYTKKMIKEQQDASPFKK
ncbi:MAG: PrsW family intramembrane metalloprotease [Chitinophagales bacterium]|nr:PrsW family glutamic-type intramembrane protease [Chitinophagales bacterium]MCZ2393885.1 PrsW family intramembrane metalloprotease [Chitinophagales bacterium]